MRQVAILEGAPVGIIVWFAVYAAMIALLTLSLWRCPDPRWQQRWLVLFAVTGIAWTGWCNWQWFRGEFLAHVFTGMICWHMTRAALIQFNDRGRAKTASNPLSMIPRGERQ